MPAAACIGSSLPAGRMGSSMTSLNPEPANRAGCSRHPRHFATLPGIILKPKAYVCRSRRAGSASPAEDRQETARTAEVIQFPGAGAENRPRNPGGGGGFGPPGRRRARYGSELSALWLLAAIVGCKHWIGWTMLLGNIAGAVVVAIIALVFASCIQQLRIRAFLLLHLAILLIVVGGFYTPLLVAPAIFGGVVAGLRLAL